eukprot:TRINITY_DN73747_c0_g1_i1.p1 TRINITY_DN73747_c0_g1~~TRINITY_DN73747_c0_g1_i1.p1  ORF type:complete len:311 (-),score=102.03 TRINITY_DN73747_c0_g1_i1:105-1010(-)
MSSASSSASSSSASGSESSSEEKGKSKRKRKVEHVASSDEDSSDVSSESSSASDDKKAKKKGKKKAKDKKSKKRDSKKKKKDKKAKNAKTSKSNGKKKEKKEKLSKDKKGKKKKKEKKGGNRDAVTNQFGKYGVIKPEDFFAKKPEFLLWAMEVKKVKTDCLGQMQMKDLFKEYIEDYNTATMVSEKYYDLGAWDTKMSVKRQRKNKSDEMTDAQKAALASFDDESARRHEIKHLQAKKQEQQVNDEIKRLRGDKEKVTEMRHQDHLRSQMDMLNRAGLTGNASKIAARLDPNKDDFGRPR